VVWLPTNSDGSRVRSILGAGHGGLVGVSGSGNGNGGGAA
jgi:NADH-quinone oxidoreductase subunit G